MAGMVSVRWLVWLVYYECLLCAGVLCADVLCGWYGVCTMSVYCVQVYFMAGMVSVLWLVWLVYYECLLCAGVLCADVLCGWYGVCTMSVYCVQVYFMAGMVSVLWLVWLVSVFRIRGSASWITDPIQGSGSENSNFFCHFFL